MTSGSCSGPSSVLRSKTTGELRSGSGAMGSLVKKRRKKMRKKKHRKMLKKTRWQRKSK